jgi:hypothetical protein
MKRKHLVVTAIAAALDGGGTPALLALAGQQAATHAKGPPATRAVGSAHASLTLDVGQGKGWVGQALPITLRAYFRNVEDVTVEGAPQLTSPGIFTSELSREPRQATEVIGGEPVLVATWTGTVTPATAAPITLEADLPVHLRYRDRAPRVELQDPFGGDAFDALAANPFDQSVIQRFFDQSVQPVLGRAHDETVALKAVARPVDVQPLPSTNQPAGFTGAIGRFNLKASVSSATAVVSEPITLKVIVDGEGDLDRVDVAGVATSESWKAYPPKSTTLEGSKGIRRQKVFEQVLIPLQPGSVRVPAVSLVAFDPSAGRYVTRETSPIDLTVGGVATKAPDPPEAVAAPVAPAPAVAHVASFRFPAIHWSFRDVAFSLGSLLLLALAAIAFKLSRRGRADRSLRRAMRRAASRGDAVPFYRAAHTLIETRLAARWGLDAATINIPVIREHLGPAADPLVEAIAADEALRFGGGCFEPANLAPLCVSIERSLGGAS